MAKLSMVKRVKVDATNNAPSLTGAEISGTVASIAARVKIIKPTGCTSRQEETRAPPRTRQVVFVSRVKISRFQRVLCPQEATRRAQACRGETTCSKKRVIIQDWKKRQATVTATATESLSLSASLRKNNRAPSSPRYASRPRSKTRVAPSIHY